MDLTDKQWQLVEPLLQLPPRTDPRGRPRSDVRSVMNGVLWILKTGAQWREMPRDKYPPYQTCHRYFQIWVRKRILFKTLATLARDLEERGGYDLSECFIDATFASAKKGEMLLVLRKKAKAPQSRKRDRTHGNLRRPRYSSQHILT
jgi:transposase